MDGNTDGAGLIRDGTRDGLADPPGGVGREFVALAVIELVHRFDQAQIALLNEIQKQHAAAHITLGDGHHQAQIGLGELLLGRLVALFHALGDVDFLLGRQKGNLADFLEVHAHGVVNADPLGHAQIDLFRLDQLFRRNGIKLRHHVHAHALERLVDLVHLIGVDLHLHELVGDLVAGDGAFVLGVLV